MQATTDRKTAAARYIQAVSDKKYALVEEILAPDLAFKGPFMSSNSSAEFVGALRRMAPVWDRSDVRAIFAEGDQACVVYDFVTSTDAGSIRSVELLTFRDDRIARVELLFDRTQFAPVLEALAQRSAQ